MRKPVLIALFIFIFLVAVPTFYITLIGTPNSENLTVNNGSGNFNWTGDFEHAGSAISPVMLTDKYVNSTFQESGSSLSSFSITVAGNGFNTTAGITLILNVTVRGEFHGSQIPDNLTMKISGGNYSVFQSNFLEFTLQNYSSGEFKMTFQQSGSTGALPVASASLGCTIKANTTQKGPYSGSFVVHSLVYIVISTHFLMPFNLSFFSSLNGLQKNVNANFGLLVSQS